MNNNKIGSTETMRTSREKPLNFRTLLLKAARSCAAGLVAAVCFNAAFAQVPANPYNYSRSIEYRYDERGRLSRRIVEPDNTPSCRGATYTYDGNGNAVMAIAASCNGAAAQTRVEATVEFSANYAPPATQAVSVSDNNNVASNVGVKYAAGLFPTSRTDAMVLTETRQFDPRFGSTLALTDANGLTTSWTVDDFGRKTKETRPDNTSTFTFYCVLTSSGLDTSSNTPGCPTPVTGEAPADSVSFIHTEPRDSTGAKSGAYRLRFFLVHVLHHGGRHGLWLQSGN